MKAVENVTSFGVVTGILLTSFNLPTYLTVPNHTSTPPAITAELPVTADAKADIKFDRVSVSSTPAPVAAVAEPQSDAAAPVKTPATTTPESTPTASPVVAPVQAPAAKKITAPTQTVVQAATTAVAPVVQRTAGLGAAIASAAYAQLGVAQNCTMLVTNSLAAVGIHYHGWPAGYLSLGTIVPASQAQPGDLAYYADGGMGLAHIAVYVGNGMAVHGGWNGDTTALFSVNVGSGPVFIRVAG